jgi:hypothetical protein
MRQENVKTRALQIAFQNETHLAMKAYWFQAWGVLRRSGILPFFAWANQATSSLALPGAHHKFLLELCGVETIEELITNANVDAQISLQLQDAIGVFEQQATGERTDRNNFPTAQTWRV